MLEYFLFFMARYSGKKLVVKAYKCPKAPTTYNTRFVCYEMPFFILFFMDMAATPLIIGYGASNTKLSAITNIINYHSGDLISNSVANSLLRGLEKK